jgi:hypothetical protein
VSCIGDDSTYKLPSTICSIVIANEIENIGNNCFTKLPQLKTLRLGKNLKYVGDSSFSYSCSKREEYAIKIPSLRVLCYQKPNFPDSAFSRGIELLIGEEYKDWGWMQTDSRFLRSHVDFVKKV